MKITDKILSAWIDESLSAKKMDAVSEAERANPDLQTRADALRSVGKMLREESFEAPVSAERMAADVQREIRLRKPSRAPAGLFWIQNLRWVPIGAAAAICLIFAARLWHPFSGPEGTAVVQAEIEYVDSELSGASPMVYTDYEAGWTVVWLDGVELEPGI
jgi:hypothetical protein